MTSYRIRISQAAALEMIMSGLTAYEAKRRTGATYVETGGELWGHSRRLSSGDRLHFVELASVSVFAKRKPDSIEDHQEEFRVKRALMGRMRPELSLIGDFHSHPYKNLSEVKANTGWGHSPEDKAYWHGADEHWSSSGGRPLFLVLAMCPLGRVRGSAQRNFYNNIVTFDVANFRFWLTAIVGREREGKRSLTSTTNSSVVLEPLPLCLTTAAGERLEHSDPFRAA